MAKTTFDDIKRALWAGANTFRDNIDASNYKDYVLSMFFVKYLSDTFDESVKELERQLANSGIVRCHRGYMVNIDNVKLLRKEGISLLIELSGGGKTIPVTKTYAASITARLAPDIV